MGGSGLASPIMILLNVQERVALQYSFESWGERWASGTNAPNSAEAAYPDSDDLRALEADFSDKDFSDTAAPFLHSSERQSVELQMEEYLHNFQRPLQAQLDHLWQIAEVHFQDNKALAGQIQQLLGEREQLLAALHAYELELGRYRHLFGNVHLKH